MEQALGIAGNDNKGALTPARPDMLFGLAENKVLQHLTGSEIRRAVGEETYRNYFKFAFVRNPYDRIVSIYSNRWRDLPRRRTSFRDFVLKRVAAGKRTGIRALFHSRPEKVLEVQFKSQYEYVFDEAGRPLTDFIGKVENLESDFNHVCARLGLNVKLPESNRSERGDFRAYYDDETKKAVGEIYRKDFVAFGYEL